MQPVFDVSHHQLSTIHNLLFVVPSKCPSHLIRSRVASGELLCCGTLSPGQTSRTKPSPVTSIASARKMSLVRTGSTRSLTKSLPQSGRSNFDPNFGFRKLCQRTMKPSDPGEVSLPPSLRLGVQLEYSSRTRLVPQRLMDSPTSRTILRCSTSSSPSSLRALIQTPDTDTDPNNRETRLNPPSPSREKD